MAKSSSSRARSGITGRYISKAAAARHPRTSIIESTSSKGGGSKVYRSTITGHYVTEATARRHPDTTVTENN